MPSKRLMGTFAFLDFCLLAAGVILIVFSEIWRMPNLMINFTLSNDMLTGGLVLGIFFLLTFVLSIGAVVQKNHVTMGFVLLNWMLIADAIVDVVVGSYIWFFTLGERAHYGKVYSALPRDTIIEIQDKIYGFMAIIVALFLASMCVIKRREEEERFKKIDAKRGGRGFV
ncbi:hypothetical protein BN946_scf184834.g28 [Trametes cinnabarina]|uniref:MARVEL domain-containing protein n=1 Tax=Pycnoporus cinnabarinus TaxID=5643 RepID=A0A060S4A8_PYCCI|nr:hypothetical protein BN946_scf184834.g28 [Trametes cinnabarina]